MLVKKKNKKKIELWNYILSWSLILFFWHCLDELLYVFFTNSKIYVLILKHLLIILRLFVLYINYYYIDCVVYYVNLFLVVVKLYVNVCAMNPALYLSNKKKKKIRKRWGTILILLLIVYKNIII